MVIKTYYETSDKNRFESMDKARQHEAILQEDYKNKADSILKNLILSQNGDLSSVLHVKTWSILQSFQMLEVVRGSAESLAMHLAVNYRYKLSEIRVCPYEIKNI